MGVFAACRRKRNHYKNTEWAIGQPVSRGLAANLIYNALNVKMAGEDVALIETITGRTYYVSPTALTTGTAKKNPWRTLGKRHRLYKQVPPLF